MLHYPVAELTHFCNINVSQCAKIPEILIDYYDFTFVLSGSMTYIVDGEVVTLHKNDAIFLKPGTHRERYAGKTPVAYTSFNFIANENITLPFSSVLRGCITENIKKLVQAFPGTHRNNHPYAQEKCTLMLNYILYELLTDYELSSKNTHIDKIQKYIDANISEKITLTQICAQINLSKEYTCALFKSQTGKTITGYINERKLSLAREYILSGEMSLSEISDQLGFNNYNYFSRRFKARFGIAPIALKNKYQ